MTIEAWALDRTWIGGNVDWVDGGSTANWNPADEPDSDDRAIFNTGNSVNLGSNNAVNGLALSGGIDLFTNEFDVTVDGLVEVAGAGTNLFIGDAAGSITADDVTINASGTLELRGGLLTMDEEVGTSLVDINAGGSLIGHGTISFVDAPVALTTVLTNDGQLTALSRGLTILSPPPVGTLLIDSANPTFMRVDLDGVGEAGVVNVNRNQTLDLNVGFADAFNGTLNLAHESTFDSLNAWTLAGGSIVVNNGFVDNPIPTPDVAAGSSFVKGGLLTQTGGSISVVDTDGTLQFDAAFSMSGGTFTNNGTVIFNAATNITTAPGYATTVSTAETIINSAMTVSDVAGNFNWDGNGTTSTTLNGTASLSLNVNQVDTGDDVYGGTLTLNDNADLSVNVAATSWTIAGALHKNNAGTSSITGDRLVITGQVNANGGTLDMPATTTTPTATLAVASTMTLGATSEFGGGTISGAGLLRMEGTSTVTANTTISVDTFDWDGLGTGTSHTINNGVVFTINSPTIDSDGDMDDPINLGGNGSQLIVNGPVQWTATAAINSNNAAAGTATIGGTSKMFFTGANADWNVNGNTIVTASLSLGASSTVDIDTGMTFDADGSTVYDGVFIDGLGTFDPGPTNTVISDSTINPDIFDFDAGNWIVEDGAELTFNVVDYDAVVAVNAFDTAITLNNGSIFANTADPEFVMDGTLNMNASGGEGAQWSGDAIDIGNDAGVLDADLNVTGDGNGSSQGRFFAPVDFNSDADVNVAAGGSLVFNGTVDFNTVNAANNAEFTGAGTLSFTNVVNVNEAVTLNMVGGTVDLDGNDAIGDFVNVDAALTINAATMSNFGRANGGGGTNTLDINNSVGTGVLTVNLDDPNAEWTLNGPGVMNLVNDNNEATLLAGSNVNINGTVNVTGDVRTTARLDISGIVNINTAGQPLRLAGGNAASDVNTIGGATIGGVGLLGADAGKALHGHGTINADIDFDGTANLRASGGVLNISGDIVDVNVLGTADETGTLNVLGAWETDGGVGGSIGAVVLDGGVLQGGVITNDNLTGLQGHGTVTARVINSSKIVATNGGTLVVQTVGNDNDWDGAGNVGDLEALSADLEMVDTTMPAPPVRTFGGSVRAINDHRVYANGFALNFLPGSSLDLEDTATYRASSSTDLGGTVTIAAGANATIQVANNFFLTFEAGSTTNLNGNVTLINNNINIDQGAVFNNGGGSITIPDGSHLVADNQADIDVLVNMHGAFRPGNFNGIGRVEIFDYQQFDTGELYVELIGTALNQYDRLVVGGDAAVDGYLNIDIDEISPGVPFVPQLGDTFNIIAAGAVIGTFDFYDVSGMPAGLAFHVNYLNNAVQLEVVNKTIYAADFDDDGDVDLTDYAIWKNAFNLNQLGDANGDNISDASDYTIWRDQLGSISGGAGVGSLFAAGQMAVPEPSLCAFLLGAVGVLLRLRGRKGR